MKLDKREEEYPGLETVPDHNGVGPWCFR